MGGYTFSVYFLRSAAVFPNSQRLPLVIIVLTLYLLLAKVDPTSSLHDDWYGFVSFKDSSEFQTAYEYTCSYSYDLFREPREFSRKENLRGRRELHTPISFSEEDTVDADTNVTLHIYNNPAIRKGFNVAYGFQRNKECLHGQDPDCVVFPELGRVRALVLNAERFSGKQDLNYIKDHFLIERPERFVSILNGGSNQERKFYEAVFLGGYSNDPTRTSHQIDGTKYPLEIYMYFLDETVPSVSLSTILVVLVQESSIDNPYIKPIVSAVEHNLYDAERRFLENNQAINRRERLFHHLDHSTHYDVYNDETSSAGENVFYHDPLESSVKHESIFTRFVEVFEKMQALETELFFYLEDLNYVIKLGEESERLLSDFANRQLIKYVPSRLTEYQMLAWATFTRGILFAREHKILEKFPSCDAFTNQWIRGLKIFNVGGISKFKNTSQIPTGEHMEEFADLVTTVCEHFDKNFKDVYDLNLNDTIMRQVSNLEKYWIINDMREERIKRNDMNVLIHQHFHGDPKTSNGTSKYHPYQDGDERAEYEDEYQKMHIADGIHGLFLKRQKRENYKNSKLAIEKLIHDIVNRLHYTSKDEMDEVIKYMKLGNKQNDLKYYRRKVHNEFVTKSLPVQEKKKTLVELGGMEIPEKEVISYEGLDPVKAVITDQFQISWLIPPDGGYYYYAGSSPIPPCFRAQNVIVFKRPITMSKRQIEVLTRIPTSFDRKEDIQFTTPRVHNTWFEVELSAPDTDHSRIEEVKVPVYNQKRNHLFLGHDGVQNNAVKEWNKILEERRIAAMGGKNKVSLTVLAIMAFFNVVNYDS